MDADSLPTAEQTPAKLQRSCPTPVVLLFLYGGLALLIGLGFAFLTHPGGVGMLTRDPQNPQHVYVMSDAQRWVAAFGWVLLGLHGFLAIAGGRYFWRQQWRRGAAAVVGGAIVLALMMYVFQVSRGLPPGRRLAQRTIDAPTTIQRNASKSSNSIHSALPLPQGFSPFEVVPLLGYDLIPKWKPGKAEKFFAFQSTAKSPTFKSEILFPLFGHLGRLDNLNSTASVWERLRGY
jgi:hypothetical protein